MAVLGSTSLTGCNSIPDFIAAGSLMLFQQTSAPTGWTKQTTHNDKALRIVSGAASSGGSTAFSSVMVSKTPAGTVDNTTLTTAQLASHGHSYNIAGGPVRPYSGGSAGTPVFSSNSGSTTGSAGSDSSHNHGFTGSAMDFAIQYVDVIIASKN